MKYLLSVVIPTRNRQKYAIDSILQIQRVTDERVQIVVQDNSDDSSLEDMILSKRVGDRVKYTYIKERISGVDNYAGGIAQSDGEYVCCIGDDDGVLRKIVDVVELAKRNNINAIKPGVQASYIWPETSKEFPTGCLGLKEVSDECFYVNPKEELKIFLESGCIDFPDALLVKAYHGIVKKEMFNHILRKTGKYCGGLSPDIYLSVALSLCTTSLLCVCFPLTIFGACRQSTTGDSINRTNVGKLEQAPHFIGQPYKWSNKVPQFYCGMNIWADSAMHALMDMGEVRLLDQYSVERLSGYCLLNYPFYRKEIMENFYANQCDKKVLRNILIESFPAFLKGKAKFYIKKIKILSKCYRFLREEWKKKRNSKDFVKQNVQDIIEAEEIISNAVDVIINTFEITTEKNISGVKNG